MLTSTQKAPTASAVVSGKSPAIRGTEKATFSDEGQICFAKRHWRMQLMRVLLYEIYRYHSTMRDEARAGGNDVDIFSGSGHSGGTSGGIATNMWTCPS